MGLRDKSKQKRQDLIIEKLKSLTCDVHHKAAFDIKPTDDGFTFDVCCEKLKEKIDRALSGNS